MDIIEFFKQDRYAAFTGIELLEAGEGKALAKLEIKEMHLNGVNTVQGGALFTLADLAFAAAANSHGTVAVSLNSFISFINSATAGTTVFAKAGEVSVHKKIATYHIDITKEDGTLISTYEGTAFRKDIELPFKKEQ